MHMYMKTNEIIE